MSLMVSVSGIRGLVGEDLHPENVVRYAAAFAAWCGAGDGSAPKRVVVGRDGRPSGKVLLDLVKGTLASCGIDVVDLGLCSTPGTAMAVKARQARGGIVLTASHNPAPWNALKFLDDEGNFLSRDKGLEVLAIEKSGEFPWQDHEHLGSYRRWKDADLHHIESILALPFIDRDAIASRKYRVAVDAVNAAGSSVMPTLLRALGIDVSPLHCEGTGIFPHEPEPTPAHLGELAERVRESGANLGLATDPDADRLVLVDETGTVLSEEYTLAIAANFHLSVDPGPVASNLSTSRMIDDLAKRHGVSSARSPVGEAHVVALMREIGAKIGGEGNGGVILSELHAGRDAMVGAALVLAAMAREGAPLSLLAAELPRYSMEKRRIETPRPVAAKELESILAGRLGGELDLSDGIRSDQPEGWIHVRPSNTESIVRLIGESSDSLWLKERLDSTQRLIQEHLP